MRRLPRVGLALLLGLLLTEGALQVLALVLAPEARSGTAAAPDERTLLCLGDSNVYGLRVSPEDAWPARLERLLNERSPDAPWSAVNLGLPGLNSRQIARQLGEELDAGTPAAVLVTVGVNNLWSWVADSAVEVVEPPWFERLRLVKLARLAARAWAEHGEAREVLASEHRFGGFETRLFEERPGGLVTGRDRAGRPIRFDSGRLAESLEPDAAVETLTADLAEMKARCERAGVPLVLVSYGGHDRGYARANANLRAAARGNGLPLVESDRALAGLEEELGYEAVYFPDQHPRETGYEAIARLAYQDLLARGIATGLPFEEPLAELGYVPRPPAPIRLAGRLEAPAGSPEALRVEVRGEQAGLPFQLLLSTDVDGPRAEVRETRLPLAEDDLFRFTLAAKEMHGRFDAEGVGTIPLAPLIGEDRRDALRGQPLLALYVLFADVETYDVLWISDAASLVIE